MSFRKIKWWIYIIFYLFLFIVTACNNKKATDEIVIGLVSSSTGEDSYYGRSISGGALLAVEEINSKGGIRGKTIRLVTYDDSSDYRATLSAAEDLILTHNPIAIIGEVVSNRTFALITVANRHQIPILSPAATGSSLIQKSNYFYRFSFSDSAQAKALVEMMKSFQAQSGQETPLTVTVLKDVHSNYSVGLTEYFRKECEGNFRILAEIALDDTDSPFKEELDLVSKLKPDVIFLPLYHKASKELIGMIRERKIKSLIFCGDGILGSHLSDEEIRRFEGVVFCSHHFVEDSTKELKEFSERYRLYNRSAADELSTLTYDATNLLILALEESMKKTDTPTTKVLIEELNLINSYKGLTGERKFSQRAGQSEPFLVRIKSQKLEKVQ